MTVPSRRRANPRAMRRARSVVAALAPLILTTSLTACVVKQEVAPIPATGAVTQNPSAAQPGSLAPPGPAAQPGSPAQPGSKTPSGSKAPSGSTATSRSTASSQQVTTAVAQTYSSRTLRINGSYDLLDVESLTADETKTGTITASKVVTSGAPASFHWEDCAGGEVQGYLDLTATLNPATGDITVSGAAGYYEGKSCGVTNDRGWRPISLTIPRGGSMNRTVTMGDANGHVLIDLNLYNE